METQQLGPIGTISGKVSQAVRPTVAANGKLTLLLRLSIEKVKKEKAK